jgi:Fe-S cluster biogenesis protein NfuA
MDLADRVAAALEHSVLPSVIARGGGLRVAAVADGVAILEVSGSPGAVLPLASRIEALIRAAVPEITGVRITGPGACGARICDRGGDLLLLAAGRGRQAAIWYSCVSPPRTCFRRIRCSAR